jgi:hypothetical protein
MLSLIALMFGSRWTAPNFVYQSLMTELDFQTSRDQKGSGSISCAMRRDSAEGSLMFGEMARKGLL